MTKYHQILDRTFRYNKRTAEKEKRLCTYEINKRILENSILREKLVSTINKSKQILLSHQFLYSKYCGLHLEYIKLLNYTTELKKANLEFNPNISG
jgi:hypothetical protein